MTVPLQYLFFASSSQQLCEKQVFSPHSANERVKGPVRCPSHCQSWVLGPRCGGNLHFSLWKGSSLWLVLGTGISIPETQACGFPWNLLWAWESSPDSAISGMFPCLSPSFLICKMGIMILFYVSATNIKYL